MRKITITTAKDRIQLIFRIRCSLTHPQVSLVKAREIVDNLPWSMDTFLSEQEILSILEDVAVFSIEEITISCESKCSPPWQSLEYLKAKQWYLSLPEVDRNKIDILVRANIAWA